MCRTHYALTLIMLYFGLAHSWDIAVSVGDRLEFYTNDGTKTDTVHFTSHNLTAIAYDEVHNMMLFVDKQSDNDAVCGYNLASTDIRCFIKRNSSNIQFIAFDPATDLLFFTDTKEGSINWISLKDQGSENNVYGNLLIKIGNRVVTDITVDSCKGYIYWSYTDGSSYMERARFNGSEREVVYGHLPVFSVAIDPQTHTNYFIDGLDYTKSWYFKKVDLIAGETEILYYPLFDLSAPKELTVSKDYLYWMNSSESHSYVWQRPKHASLVSLIKPREISKFHIERPHGIAANYKINDQVQGLQDCEALSSLITTITVTDNSRNIVQEQIPASETDLTRETAIVAGHTKETERCEVDACHGYCLNDGVCSVNEKRDAVCQCINNYVGDRCEVSSCLNYCLQGTCSFDDEGHPECRCDAGYSGPRCEVNVCNSYCLNSGECSLNEEDEPVCQCVDNHEGSRCEAVKNVTLTNATQYYSEKINITLADLLSNWRKPTVNISVIVQV